MEEKLLEIVDYERQLGEELDLAKQEAEEIVQQARIAARDLIEKERAELHLLDEKYEENLKRELQQEENKLLEGKEKELEQIKQIDEIKIDELVSFVLEKIVMGLKHDH